MVILIRVDRWRGFVAIKPMWQWNCDEEKEEEKKRRIKIINVESVLQCLCFCAM
jgi:hypothetical protein